jgi:5-oxopent-3-ene-1,2,5-tricarboxylate decarboxylase/2-hydroxyhepta-2,4-diene-1,7-dioate isomerase
VVNVMPGDEVVTEIDGIGRLVNTIVGDHLFGRPGHEPGRPSDR